MGEQQPMEYYDKLWADPRYQKPAEEMHRWLQLWRTTRSFIKYYLKRKYNHIVDLGCGPGHLAELVAGLPDSFTYTGYDFSPTAIAVANKKVTDEVTDPRFVFEVKDLETFNFVADWSKVVYVANEFFEHIEFDLDIIEKIPAGCPVLFSVPAFDDPAHVRCHKDSDDVRARYTDLLDIESIVTMPDGYRFFVEATRR